MKKVLCFVAELVLLSTVAFPVAYAQYIAPEPEPVKIVINEKNHGSGFHIGEGLYITSYHVVYNMKKQDILVKNQSGKSAKFRFVRSNRGYDIALLKGPEDFVPKLNIDCEPEYNFDMDLRTLGNPMTLDFIQFRVKIAGKRVRNNLAAALIPIDGTIIPGMSGGPVLKENGQVVGINTGVAVDYRNETRPILPLSFMTPSDVICDFLDGTLTPDSKTQITKQ